MQTQDWKSESAKILVIGHDPRLQKSDTIAGYALFADYYFRPEPTSQSERKKYGLAKATFDMISEITNGKFPAESIFITNLCNEALDHAPKGKTVLIQRVKAENGLNNIVKILAEYPSIQYIFPMSLQVNYWLQKLGFYSSGCDFLARSEPKSEGIDNNLPYFESKSQRTFINICGNAYKINGGKQIVIPILHVKCFPLNKRVAAYEGSYQLIKSYFN